MPVCTSQHMKCDAREAKKGVRFDGERGERGREGRRQENETERTLTVSRKLRFLGRTTRYMTPGT